MNIPPAKRYRLWSDIRLLDEAGAMLREAGEVSGPGFEPRHEDALRGLADADAALVGPGFPGTREVFARAPRLKVIARIGTGYDNIDVEAATALGICVTNTPDAPTIATAELTFGLILAVSRNIAVADRRLRATGWVSALELIRTDLAGKTLGLIGLGRIGARVARIAQAVEMTVIAHDPFVSAEAARAKNIRLAPTLAALLAESDVVSLHVPLTPETRHLIDPERLALMKKSAILINASRGPVINESALLEALRAGRLRGVGLDVWENEPISREHPLLALDNVVATPHIAAATAEGRRRSNVTAATFALMVLRGDRPSGLLNPGVWSQRRMD